MDITAEESFGIATKRQVLAQIVVCSGCCCGRTDKGKPEIPVDWLKQTWKERRLQKHVQLTISGCLGPCDIVNVVSMITGEGQRWFGGIEGAEPFRWLVEWAQETADLGESAELPAELLQYEFQRFV
ncbi:(2Fe-2S) ferredoxin domain-containing protein [Alicyclobacillus fastidiosus]|uniref:(2Fe-2S) ferredoxin domain-containing protein n=1 Tax=Alicyclobacillus fastidiosus TaxID=392011 RepID=A0ABY6ZG82_9BACL|nr:(2Fe-2S) ferredoxin domain-containing protein [Alicyclobacillus fastidiosus]WAH41740.1 (2Fe-2S) ferredoxin domain-containing protein [Alicyclobacillus fastidiosus]GMA63429.1 hypothetical protein GCM10025859_38690 [Alicyclobacillus fastidiosus]